MLLIAYLSASCLLGRFLALLPLACPRLAPSTMPGILTDAGNEARAKS